MNRSAPLIAKAFLLHLANLAREPAFPFSQEPVTAATRERPPAPAGDGNVRGERVRYAGKAMRGLILMTPKRDFGQPGKEAA